jgi:hypothetical protein
MSMANAAPQYLYLLDEDLYRLGNATSPRLHNVRPGDVTRYERNGVVMVRADGFGISLATEQRIKRTNPRGSYLWKIPANFPMPRGLALNPDRNSISKPGDAADHYFLCPQYDMMLSEYVALLSKLALHLERVRKL